MDVIRIPVKADVFPNRICSLFYTITTYPQISETNHVSIHATSLYIILALVTKTVPQFRDTLQCEIVENYRLAVLEPIYISCSSKSPIFNSSRSNPRAKYQYLCKELYFYNWNFQKIMKWIRLVCDQPYSSQYTVPVQSFCRSRLNRWTRLILLEEASLFERWPRAFRAEFLILNNCDELYSFCSTTCLFWIRAVVD